ncbi:MAG: bifunctional response regulator/alkaline phosphatase family protein [Bacteroidetes bacterium]|nr:bifunctional response regulator/alkaline phosphatase family protein [Bacteroidota bacterium]
MGKVKILWVDDEIDLLRSQILFLEQKGYDVVTSNNGDEALDLISISSFDIIFLDENMPGLSGLETLDVIKQRQPNLPVVMITKSEEESIMDDAIGSKISDYLIKPVNPNQILLSLKKTLDDKKLISEKSMHSYQMEFRSIGMELNNNLNYQEWAEIYRKLTRWELELERSKDQGILEVLKMQKDEANQVFIKFFEKNYLDWLAAKTDDRPIMSHTLLKEKLFPLLDNPEPLFFLLIDNLRYDQWKAIQPLIEEFYRVENDEIFYSILPSTTQYARNALFSGLMPLDIELKYPKYWTRESEKGSKNKFESELLGELLKRYGKDIKYSYHKILNLNAGRKLLENLPNLMSNRLNVIVYNFVDMLSHARTDMQIIQELADDEPAYRSLMLSWFEHSSLFDVIKYLSKQKVKLIITTDHGSVRVQHPVKIVGDRETNSNLRYKQGRNLNYDSKDIFTLSKPEDGFLSRENVSTSFAFCKKNNFFTYPNNYNHYVNLYKNTFQHGGISIEELLIPFITLNPK